MIQRSTFRRDWRASGCNGRSLLLALQTLRCPLIEPGEENPKGEADRRGHDDPAHQPLGNLEERKDLRRHLHQEPRARGIKRRRPEDIAPPQLGEEVARIHDQLLRLLRRERGDDFFEARIAAERVPEREQF